MVVAAAHETDLEAVIFVSGVQTLDQLVQLVVQELPGGHHIVLTLPVPVTGPAGFDRAFRNLETAPCQGPDASAVCLLLKQ